MKSCKLPMKTVLVAAGALAVLLLSSEEPRAFQTKELPQSTSKLGTFAFPDPPGARLLSVGDPSEPGTLRTALCSGGDRFPVQFEKHQTAGPGTNGRQSSFTFDKVAGHVFSLAQGHVGAGASCFLASDELMSSATWLRTEAASRAMVSAGCPSNVRKRVAASRNRSVTRCWPLAHATGNQQVVLVEFARRGTSALASVVLLDRDRRLFVDYPATFEREGKDLWRADDGGVLSPEGFEIVFLLQRARSYLLGVSWAGSEGKALSVFLSNDDSKFTQVIADYWYQAPY